MYLVQCALHQTLCSNAVVFLHQFLLKGTAVYTNTDGDIPFLCHVNYSLDPLCTSNVSRIDADLICAVLHGRNGKSVVEMNVCNQGNMNLLLNLLQRPGSFHGRHCTADDVAACCLQGKDLGYCCFYIFCFGIGHGLDQNGIASADLFVSNLYYFCMVSVHIFPPISKGHERDAVI